MHYERFPSLRPPIEGPHKEVASYRLWPGLEVRPEDIEMNKTRYSAFIEGSSDLEAVLRARGIDTILITGTTTNVCCESTARDGMMRNFRTVMVSDGCAAHSEDEHTMTLVNIALFFGDVQTTDAVTAKLDQAAGRVQAAE